MAKFILFLDRLVILYMYFILGACMLSWVPNINPNYPLFYYIFKLAGCYIIPPIMGLGLGPALIMVVCALISMGLRKIYDKFYADKESKIVVLTPEELMEKLKKQKEGNKKDDCD
ncbi:MAG: YggT family protein [Candidatus Gastranaerophilales bacterium]|nr:YggT family protein [Candidatus Gastranaerophilales bacterium]